MSDTLNITGVLDLSGLFDALVFTGTPDGSSTYLLATLRFNQRHLQLRASVRRLPVHLRLPLELSPLTPVPEPSTWVAGALALLAVGYTQRRRFSRKPALASIA